MIINVRIHGIPCRAEVTHYRAEVPGFYTGRPEDCFPTDPAEVEFNVLDRHGRPAPWLERIMDDCDTRAIEQEIIAAHENAFNEYGAYA